MTNPTPADMARAVAEADPRCYGSAGDFFVDDPVHGATPWFLIDGDEATISAEASEAMQIAVLGGMRFSETRSMVHQLWLASKLSVEEYRLATLKARYAQLQQAGEG